MRRDEFTENLSRPWKMKKLDQLSLIWTLLARIGFEIWIFELVYFYSGQSGHHINPLISPLRLP